MKKIMVCMFCIIWASATYADELVLVESVPGPDSRVRGLAVDSGNLWICYSSTASTYKGKIVKIDMSGNILTSFDAPGKMSLYDVPATVGLTFDGTYLWNANYLDNTLYKITTSGEVAGTLSIPKNTNDLAWDGSNIWISNTGNNKVYKINPLDGEIIHTVNTPGWEDDREPDGMAYDGEYLWVSNSYGRNVYRIDAQTGEIVTQFSNILSYEAAEALAWDGQYIWIAGESSAIKKYKIAQPPEGYPNPTVEQVNILPDNFDGLTVYFDSAEFYSNIKKDISFDNVIHITAGRSKDGTYYSSSLKEDEINFYVSEAFATDIIFADLGGDSYDANLFCTIEKKTASDGEKHYWMAKIIKVEIRGTEGQITQTLQETGTLPPSPVAAERAKWDINMDNRIGLEEAIRALQITAGSREPEK
ncbi:MAG: hypothetical protein GY749_27410 [Desulfobacteraceae bacterium]|nr:hypothetical protein [Desulfobacteraceae bacterium]